MLALATQDEVESLSNKIDALMEHLGCDFMNTIATNGFKVTVIKRMPQAPSNMTKVEGTTIYD